MPASSNRCANAVAIAVSYSPLLLNRCSVPEKGIQSD